MTDSKTVVNMTEEEYIQYELESDIRHEYVNGQLIDMPGESGANNLIALNLVIILRLALRGTKYRIYAHDIKLRVPNERTYFYPDLFVSDEEVNTKKYVYTTAVLVAEVLSGSTSSYDSIDKFIEYRKIPELQYYMLIEPVKKVVQLFTKEENGRWSLDYYTEPKEIIALNYLKVQFTLSDLFE